MRKGKLTEEQRAEIVRRYAAGEKGADLGREFGVNQSWVCGLARKVQIEKPRGPGKFTEEQRASILAERLEGGRRSAIAKKYGCHPTMVDWLVKSVKASIPDGRRSRIKPRNSAGISLTARP